MPWPLALFPALTFGLAAAVPFLYLAATHQARKCKMVAIAYLAACIGEWSLMFTPDGSVQDNIGAALMFALMVIGTTHAFVWRETLTLTGAGDDDGARPDIAPMHLPPTIDPTAETCARLRRTMTELKTSVAGRTNLSPACRRLLAETFVPINQVLVFGAGGGRADAELRTVEAMLTDYLPTSLDTYDRLPPEFARTHRNPDGRTADQELETQLRLIRDGATEVAASLYDDGALRLQEQSTFLQAKFGRSELDLS